MKNKLNVAIVFIYGFVLFLILMLIENVIVINYDYGILEIVLIALSLAVLLPVALIASKSYRELNILDYILHILLVAFVFNQIYLLINRSLFCNCIYKRINIWHCIVVIVLIIIRKINIKKKNNNQETIDVAMSLISIYKKAIDIFDNGGYIADIAVDEDIFGREATITTIRELIKDNKRNCQVIGIDGKWGAGKSTLINVVLREMREERINYIYVSFDPWKYYDSKTTTNEFLNIIYNKVVNDHSSENQKTIDNLISLMFGEEKGKKLKRISNSLFNIEENDIFEKYTELINEKLNENNRLIISINNLDRVEYKNIDLIIKLITNILSLKHTTALLEYDSVLLDKSVQKVYGGRPNYFDKYIDVIVKVPEVSQNQTQLVIGKCLENSVIEIEDERVGFKDLKIDPEFDNVRQIIKILNQLYAFYKCKYKFLYLQDYIDLCIIRMYCPELYEKIYENKETLAFHDSYQINKEGDEGVLEKDKNKVLNSLEKIDNYKKYENLIRRMFADDVKDVQKNSKTLAEMRYNCMISNKYRRINNIKYYSLYFEEKENDYSLLQTEINRLIDLFKTNNDKDIKDTIESIINKINGENINGMAIVIDEINKNKEEIERNNLTILEYLYMFADYCDSANLGRVAKLMMELCDGYRILTILFKKHIYDYKNYFLFFVIDNSIEANSPDNVFRSNYSSAIENITSPNSKINLFSKGNYKKGISAVIKTHCAEPEEYISRMVNKENIYRYINEISYIRDNNIKIKEELEKVFIPSDKILALVENSLARNDVQEYVQKGIKTLLKPGHVFIGRHNFKEAEELLSE